MMNYVNRRFFCCHTAVSSEMIEYVNRRSYCYHTAVLGRIIGYVNGESYYCHTAIPSGVLESDKRAQLTECKMRKSRLVGW